MRPRPAHGGELRAEAALAEESAAGCHPAVTVCADCRGDHELAIYETAMLAHEPPRNSGVRYFMRCSYEG